MTPIKLDRRINDFSKYTLMSYVLRMSCKKKLIECNKMNQLKSNERLASVLYITFFLVCLMPLIIIASWHKKEIFFG